MGLPGLCGCGGLPCAPDPAECAPLYEPTWDNVYSQTLVPSCALEGGCHATDSASGGFEVSEDQAATYQSLLTRIEPGDGACSDLLRRLEADEVGSMPPGSPLPESEVCAIQQWVADGAQEGP